ALVIDISTGAEPLDDIAQRIADRKCAAQVPAVHAIGGATKTVFDFVSLAGSYGLATLFDTPKKILGVKHGTPAPTFSLLESQTGVLEPTAIVIIKPTVRARSPDDLRDRIEGGIENALINLTHDKTGLKRFQKLRNKSAEAAVRKNGNEIPALAKLG